MKLWSIFISFAHGEGYSCGSHVVRQRKILLSWRLWHGWLTSWNMHGSENDRTFMLRAHYFYLYVTYHACFQKPTNNLIITQIDKQLTDTMRLLNDFFSRNHRVSTKTKRKDKEPTIWQRDQKTQNLRWTFLTSYSELQHMWQSQSLTCKCSRLLCH